ncbi:MAG: hypothetical protein WCS15_06925 [Prevotella sp.]
MIIEILAGNKERLEEIRDSEVEKYDNMPESFQEGEKGEAMQTWIDAIEESVDNLDSAIDSLEAE